jgi:kumamolisin
LHSGTYISAPILTGLFKVSGGSGHRGKVNQRLYVYALGAMSDEAVTGLRDVTEGNNTCNKVAGYSAGPGYDLVTGNGTPDMANLAAEHPQ